VLVLMLDTLLERLLDHKKAVSYLVVLSAQVLEQQLVQWLALLLAQLNMVVKLGN
jgi:hypothetical protein